MRCMPFALVEVDRFLPCHGKPLTQLRRANILQLQAGVEKFSKNSPVRISALDSATQDPEKGHLQIGKRVTDRVRSNKAAHEYAMQLIMRRRRRILRVALNMKGVFHLPIIELQPQFGVLDAHPDSKVGDVENIFGGLLIGDAVLCG